MEKFEFDFIGHGLDAHHCKVSTPHPPHKTREYDTVNNGTLAEFCRGQEGGGVDITVTKDIPGGASYPDHYAGHWAFDIDTLLSPAQYPSWGRPSWLAPHFSLEAAQASVEPGNQIHIIVSTPVGFVPVPLIMYAGGEHQIASIRQSGVWNDYERPSPMQQTVGKFIARGFWDR